MDENSDRFEILHLATMAMIGAYDQLAKLLLMLPIPIAVPSWADGGHSGAVQVAAIDNARTLLAGMPMPEEMADLMEEAVIEWLTLHELVVVLVDRDKERPHDRAMIVYAIIRAGDGIRKATDLARTMS
ncbi:MAG: hypothetical protein HOQ38_07890 [Nonomuraea sp.]|nr:hypothetical protein [Nonomuraea sp.]